MTDELRDGLIARIVKERTRQKLSQAELGRRIGKPKSVISRLESGKHSPSLETLYDVGKGLGLRLDIKIVKQR